MTSYVSKFAQAERHRSSAAVWSQKLATFAAPFLLIIILGHRFGAIGTLPTFWLLGMLILILLIAIVAGVRGFYELWTYGHKGGLASARALALAVLLMVPFVYQGIRAFTHPQLYDISTDLEAAPDFDTALDDRTEQMNPVLEPTPESALLQLRAYPSVTARRYPLGIGRVFRTVVALIGERGWVILTANTQQGQAPIDEEGSGLVAKAVTNASGLPIRPAVPNFRPSIVSPNEVETVTPPFETVVVSPTGRENDDTNPPSDERYVEAVAASLIFGFESDVVIRMVEEEDGTLVDMRSVSRWGAHDLGANAQQVLEFLKDLDAALQGLGQES